MCGIILFFFILMAFLGNIAVIYAAIVTPQPREQYSNLFIINLAITDMSNSCLVMTTSFVCLVADVIYIHPIWCNVVCALNYTLIVGSMLTLSFISIDRYVAVIHPLSYKQIMTRNKILVMIMYAWFQGFAFGLTPIILNWNHYDYWEVVCAVDWQNEKEQIIYFVSVGITICFFIPGLIIIFCYSHIYIVKRYRVSNYSIHIKTRSLLIVVIMFFICLTPFCVTKFLKVLFTNPYFVPPYVSLVSAMFAFLASVVNPFIYGILRHDFRVAYRQLYLHYFCTSCRQKGTITPTNRSRRCSCTYNMDNLQGTLDEQFESVEIDELKEALQGV